jgi:hypothetical protein
MNYKIGLKIDVILDLVTGKVYWQNWKMLYGDQVLGKSTTKAFLIEDSGAGQNEETND